MDNYNYDNFSTDEFDFDQFNGPAIGDKAPDFVLKTADNQAVRLLDFAGDFLLLELGSITCPLFQSRRTGMSRLDAHHDNVSSAILYVREAHPGNNVPSHKSFEDKQECAQTLKQEDGETRLILVDDFAGTAHKAYGGYPNSVFIINRNGCVVFRAKWNNPVSTAKALDALVAGKAVKVKNYFFPAKPAVVFHTLGRGGKESFVDFFRGLPMLVWVNFIKRNARLLFNSAPTQDVVC